MGGPVDVTGMRWEAGDLVVEVLFSQRGVATQFLVRAGPTQLLFDVGDGTLRDLLARGYDPKELDGVFCTHGHADHMAGLYALVGFLRADGYQGDFLVGYPRGCCEARHVLQGFRTCYGDSIPFAIREVELGDGDAVQLAGGPKVLAREVQHWHSIRGKPLSPAPATGYRLTFRGQAVAITGDTAWCPVLEWLVKDTDLALIEASLDEGVAEESEKIHLTLEQALRLSQLAKASFLVHRPDGRVLRV